MERHREIKQILSKIDSSHIPAGDLLNRTFDRAALSTKGLNY